MLGYMTSKEAVSHGFTHYGSYYGIPIWLANIDNEAGGLMVATKWAPMEYAMTVGHVIEGLLLATFFPEREPAFAFVVRGVIEQEAAA